MVTIDPGPPSAPGKTKKPELDKAQATFNSNHKVVIGSSKNENNSITKFDFLEAPELPDFNSSRIPGATQLSPSATGRIRYQFDAIPVDANPPAYRRSVNVPGNAKALRSCLGKLIARSEDQVSCLMTLSQLAHYSGISQRSLSDNIWRLRLAGEIITLRVHLNSKHDRRWSYRFFFPSMVSKDVFRLALEQLEEDKACRAAYSASKCQGSLFSSSSPDRKPGQAPSVDAESACRKRTPNIRSTKLEDHHESELHDGPSGLTENASGYGGPTGPEQGEETSNAPRKKRSAKNRNLSPAVQADIAARKARDLLEASAELTRTDVHEETQSTTDAREVPPAGPGAAPEEPQGLNLAAQDTLAALPVAKEAHEVTESSSPSLKPTEGETPPSEPLVDNATVQMAAELTHSEPVADQVTMELQTPASPPRRRKTSPAPSLSLDQAEAMRVLAKAGVHLHKARSLATSHPPRLIAQILHDLRSQKGIRSVPAWIVRAIERGGYKSASAVQISLEARRKAAREREKVEDEREKGAISTAEDQRREAILEMVHPDRRQTWEADAFALLNRSERGYVAQFGKNHPISQGAINRHREHLAKSGAYREPG